MVVGAVDVVGALVEVVVGGRLVVVGAAVVGRSGDVVEEGTTCGAAHPDTSNIRIATDRRMQDQVKYLVGL